MSKIVKNVTGSPINLIDVGVTIPANDQYSIPPQDYLLWAASNNIITHVGAGDIVINDGSSDLSISDGVDLIKAIFPKEFYLKGDTDGTKAGNVGDRLKVDSSFSQTSIGYGAPMPVIKMPLIYDDMNASNGGISRDTSVGTSFTTVYSKTGSGLLLGVLLTLESANSDWTVRLTVDGTVVYSLLTSDLNDNNIYNFDKNAKDFDEEFGGIFYGDKTFRWKSPQNTGLVYNSSILVEVKRGSGTKKFRAGLIVRTTN